ncbi:MAG: winged helix-turn-helix domain-containing protein [bacterium]
MVELDRFLDRFDLKTLRGAFARRRARERQLAKVRAKRQKLEAELAELDAVIGGGSSKRRARSGVVIERKPNARSLNDIPLADALEKVLRAAKKPVHYKALTETVVKRGLYRTKSKNLLTTVAITLKRDGRFKKVRPAIWTLTK